jgi:excinuclease ABC subunit A
MGYKRIQMYFLAPLKVPCPECQGLRLNSTSLRVSYKGLSFGKLLQLSVQEALSLFEHIRKAKKILESLLELGLGYVKLGHEVSSLSNGEFQRVKIAKELSKQRSRKTLYLLDEPTSGLHIREVHMLLKVLERLKERGDTIIAVEHNEEFIRSSDWLLELGPGAGEKGGHIVFEGQVHEYKGIL